MNASGLFTAAIILLCSCGAKEVRQAVNDIKNKYRAEDVTWHEAPLNKPGGPEIAELIVVNSPVLKESRMDYLEGLEIAKKFYRSFGDHPPYCGVKVVISNRREGEVTMGFSKDYYYDENLLK